MVSGGEGVTFLNAVDSEQWPLGQKNKNKNLPVLVKAAVMEWWIHPKEEDVEVEGGL